METPTIEPCLQSTPQEAPLEAEALGSQLRELQPRMTSVALRFAPDRDSAEDIVQSAFEKALRKRDQFRGHARFSTWLHRIVVNESLMWLRSERRRSRRHIDLDEAALPELAANELDAAEHLLARQRQERLERGLLRLPAEEREVLQRCALQEVSYEQFSSETGIRPAAAKSRAFRGRRRLRALLGEEEALGAGR